MLRQNDLNKARAAFTEQSPTVIMPTGKMPSRDGCFAVPNPTSLNALWRNLDYGKSTTHRACRFRGNSGRGICRLGHKTILPEHHVTDETKNLVSVSMAVV